MSVFLFDALQIALEQGSPVSTKPASLHERCYSDAVALVEKAAKHMNKRNLLPNKRTMELITGLTSIMLQVQVKFCFLLYVEYPECRWLFLNTINNLFLLAEFGW